MMTEHTIRPTERPMEASMFRSLTLTYRILALLSPALLLTVGCAEAAPVPVPVPVPGPAPAPAPQVTGQSANTIFVDEFSEAKGEWQQLSGIWELRSGFLSQTSDDPRKLNTIKYIQTPRVSDATIETQLRVVPYRPSQWTDSPADEDRKRNIRYIIGAGIIFRMKDPDNFYMFRLAGEEGAVLGRMVDGSWNEADLCNPRVLDFLRGDRIGFRADNWYRLKVEAYANRFTTYINDEPVCSVVDNTFELGHVGLVTFKTAADFDWIRITR